MCVRERLHVRALVGACVCDCGYEHAGGRAYACGRAYVRVGVRICLCMRGHVSACVRALCAYACAYTSARV